MASHINDFFEACTPKKEQKIRIFNKILDEVIDINSSGISFSDYKLLLHIIKSEEEIRKNIDKF